MTPFPIPNLIPGPVLWPTPIMQTCAVCGLRVPKCRMLGERCRNCDDSVREIAYCVACNTNLGFSDPLDVGPFLCGGCEKGVRRRV